MNDRLKTFLARFIIAICQLFPIKTNKIFFYSYYGSNYGCNPKYITEYIVKHYPYGQFDLVWAFHDPESRRNTHFRTVKTMSLRYFYEWCTAKIVITNYRTTGLYRKRKGQYYIQTWHSSLRLKKIEKDAISSLPKSYVSMAKKDAAKCDLLLSGCMYSTAIFRRSFWYEGEIFEHGTPRNDLFFRSNSAVRGKVMRKFKIPAYAKLLLYAPTFRKDGHMQPEKPDFALLKEKLTEKFGGKWVVLSKLHPHLIGKSADMSSGESVIDVTNHDDMQELLAAADILISDYSSLIFDYALTKRPCFLYVPDLAAYIERERELYFDIRTLPFMSAGSMEDLLLKIHTYDDWQYRQDVTTFLQRIGSYENGKASENLVKRMEAVCFGEKRRLTHEAV